MEKGVNQLAAAERKASRDSAGNPPPGQQSAITFHLSVTGLRRPRGPFRESCPRLATLRGGPLLTTPENPASTAMLAGNAAFRQVFPLSLCFPAVVPQDEVVCLKMFHRADEPLLRLFATPEQARELDRLWGEPTFVSRQPVAENDFLPQFMEYTTQDMNGDTNFAAVSRSMDTPGKPQPR